MSNLILSIVEGLGEDYLVDKANEYAEEHFQPVKDPFYEKIKLPNGETKEIRRKLPKDLFGKKESKAWKSIQNRAWMHDRSMCGCCCWTDTIGWAPLLALLPLIGPGIMYLIHNKLITQADKSFRLPLELKAKMHGNIMVDLCISLVPILGTLFSWLHACSTRNAAMVYNYIVQRALEQNQTTPQEMDNSRPPMTQPIQTRQQKQLHQTRKTNNYGSSRDYQYNDRNNYSDDNYKKINPFEVENLGDEHNSTNRNKNQSYINIPTAPPRVQYRLNNNSLSQKQPQSLMPQQISLQREQRLNQQQVYYDRHNVDSPFGAQYSERKPDLPHLSDR